MNFREDYIESRARYLAAYDADEATKYDAWVTSLTQADHEACLADINQQFRFSSGQAVLDAGAGTGALSLSIAMIPGVQITALEPCVAMLDKLHSKPELQDVVTVQGFCDHTSDRSHFGPERFDVVTSRQLTNCLFDPLAAFRNWHYWLRAAGVVIVIDGLYDRSAWSGCWDGMVDTLPLSACRTTATVPYLLEQVGFRVDHVGLMEKTNTLPSTRTPRYLVVASKK